MSDNKGKSYRKETLEATIKKRKECSAKALKVVEQLIEKDVTDELLLQNVRYINQESYQDIIDERSITNLCGYPVCNNDLKNISQHQYKITRTNGTLILYDTTERKKFCSNICYKAAKYLKDQLPSCPLWLIQWKETDSVKLLRTRCNSEDGLGEKITFDSSDYKDLSPDTASNVNSMSDNVDASLTNSNIEKQSIIDKVSNEDDKNVTHDLSDDDEQFEDAVDSDETLFSESSSGVLLNNISDKKCEVNVISKDKIIECKPNSVDGLCDVGNNCENVKLIKNCDMPDKEIENIERTRTKSKLKKKSKHKTTEVENNVSPMMAAVLRVEQSIREWISLDTLIFVLGEDKLKHMIDATCGLEKFKSLTQNTMRDPAVYERYLDICKKLNLLELHESKLDSSYKNENNSVPGPTKRVPDFEKLKEEAKEMEIKVRSFYRGDKQVQFKEDKHDKEPVVIPLVDQHAQRALRRRIVLDHLNRVLPDILRALGLIKYNNIISSEVKTLVETFTLSAHNVMFRPAEWNFVALVIIKLLSVHNDVLNQLLSMERADKYLTLMLMSYEQDTEYLNRIITWLLYEHSLFIS